MVDADVREFTALLDQTCELLSRGQYRPDSSNAALWFRTLQHHDIDTVRAAFNAHIRDPQRGRFVPSPADILGHIGTAMANADGRPGPEEAWATACRAVDERATVVWTAEMAAAWETARHVHAAGDEVGARMAFREAYARLVAAARQDRTPVAWIESLGHDPTTHAGPIARAVAAGLLPAPEPLAQLGFDSVESKAQADRARVDRLMARMAELQAGRKALDWAHELEQRDREPGAKVAAVLAVVPGPGGRVAEVVQVEVEAGITLGQRQAYVAALEVAPGESGLTGFRPIPESDWPAAMRAECSRHRGGYVPPAPPATSYDQDAR